MKAYLHCVSCLNNLVEAGTDSRQSMFFAQCSDDKRKKQQASRQEKNRKSINHLQFIKMNPFPDLLKCQSAPNYQVFQEEAEE